MAEQASVFPFLEATQLHKQLTPGACPKMKHLKGAPIGLALFLPSNSKTALERVSKDKHSSLFGFVVHVIREPLLREYYRSIHVPLASCLTGLD